MDCIPAIIWSVSSGQSYYYTKILYSGSGSGRFCGSSSGTADSGAFCAFLHPVVRICSSIQCSASCDSVQCSVFWREAGAKNVKTFISSMDYCYCCNQCTGFVCSPGWKNFPSAGWFCSASPVWFFRRTWNAGSTGSNLGDAGILAERRGIFAWLCICNNRAAFRDNRRNYSDSSGRKKKMACRYQTSSE